MISSGCAVGNKQRTVASYNLERFPFQFFFLLSFLKASHCLHLSATCYYHNWFFASAVKKSGAVTRPAANLALNERAGLLPCCLSRCKTKGIYSVQLLCWVTVCLTGSVKQYGLTAGCGWPLVFVVKFVDWRHSFFSTTHVRYDSMSDWALPFLLACFLPHTHRWHFKITLCTSSCICRLTGNVKHTKLRGGAITANC